MPNHAVTILRWQATVILTLFFTALAGAAAVGWWYARDSSPHQGPIVLIAVDGLSHDRLQALMPQPADPGAPDPAAPEDSDSASAAASPLRALAADAVVFERAYSHSPHLLPAYASLLAGRLPFEHGVRDEAGFTLPVDVRTLPELLRNRGFATGAAVSAPILQPDSGIHQGFTFFDASPAGDVLAQIDAASAGDTTDPPAEEPRAIDAAERWARAQENQRYFLMLQVDAQDVDPAVARITSLLREHGSYERSTIVVVGSRGRTGADASLDEATLLVPMLVKQPNSEHAGLRVGALVQHVDVLPTLLDLVRAPIPRDVRGRSLKPLLTSENGHITPQPIYAESLAAYYRFGGHPLFALTVSDVRYVEGSGESLVRLPSAATGVEPAPADGALPDEGADGTDAAPLRATLDRLLTGDVLQPANTIPEAAVERLASTGYLQGLPADGEVLPGASLRPEAQDAALDAHQEAAQLAGGHRYTAAMRGLQAIARTHPDLSDLHYQIGLIGLRGGRLQEAVASLREAATRRPDSTEVASQLAVALFRSGRTDEARLEAERAVAVASALHPVRRATAHIVAARLALAAGDDEGARAHAAAAEGLDSTRPMRAYVDAALMAREGETEAALPIFEKAVRQLRQHDDAVLEGLHLALADALVRVERMSEAEAAFRDELRAFPASIPAYAGLAALYHSTDRTDAAARALRVMLDAVPTRESYAAAAATWIALGERTRADAVRFEARARFRGDPLPAPRSSGRAR